ncbi:DUF6230 family protein [Streptomyces indicus]|uniref:Cholesterol esterase n=1 Tax=Streptomyces indicus TaxID=417292 RepID=A0A1G8WCX3_9ACTN|nr:DUF6230 family protein [Streptomyces indicus]SDJ76061.1 hypothetical protein SAMN05421806_102383 [Streptomyces indicus]
MESVARGGTRWKRFAVVMVPSVAATAAIGVALSQGALAASFSVSGQSFKVTANELDGRNMLQYGGVDVGVDMEGKKAAHPVAINAFKKAYITNLCQSVVTHVPVIGDVTLKLTAGGKGTPVEADNIYIDVAQLESSEATFSNVDIGVAAGSAGDKVPPMKGGGEQANPNGFAQRADRAVIKDVKQTAWATSAGTFKLSGFGMALSKGKNECY